jgi:hypothetical protein
MDRQSGSGMDQARFNRHYPTRSEGVIVMPIFRLTVALEVPFHQSRTFGANLLESTIHYLLADSAKGASKS